MEYFRLCLLGRRLLKDLNVLTDCNKNVSGVLHKLYCGNGTRCDPYYVENNLTVVNGIRGLASGVFLGRIITFSLYQRINRKLTNLSHYPCCV